MMFRSPLRFLSGVLGALTLAAAPALASDHADTVANATRPGADMADVYIFPSTSSANNVVIVMNVHPLIPAGQGTTTNFDPNVLYQIKIDTNGDANITEDLVIQVRFSGTGAAQRAVVSGPYKPYTTGTTATFARPYGTTGLINTTFSPTPGMTVFTGGRSDPFFFDLAQFFAIFPDRGYPAGGQQSPYATIAAADTPNMTVDTTTKTMKAGFRGFTAANPSYNQSPASDLLAGFNLLSIVVELPRAMLADATTGKVGVIRLWETTSPLGGAPSFQFTQQDRLARPAVNEALATVAVNRHMTNNSVSPVNDKTTIQTDIAAFMSFPAGRSADVAAGIIKVLIPDVMIADLSNSGPAGYLGYEATGGKAFGGRKLTDDVIDADLGAIFGSTIIALGLAGEDNAEKPMFATDNVGAHTDYMTVFPYLGVPH